LGISSIICVAVLVPMRLAPALIMARASFRVRMPPAALTPISLPTARLMSFMSFIVAVPPNSPVEVFTKSAPASLASLHAVRFSGFVRRLVSMMTLVVMFGFRCLVATTASMSFLTAW